MPQDTLHFSISERKLYLRFFDVIFALTGLLVVSYYFNFQYFNIASSKNISWIFLLAVYVWFFGEIFEMYDLKVASDQYLTLRSTLITVVFTVLFYVFTPIISPELPQNRIQVVYFTLTLLFAILLNRFLYIQFIFSPRFLKNILLIGNRDEIEKLVNSITDNEAIKTVAYISEHPIDSLGEALFISSTTIKIEKLVLTKNINEILVSSNNLNFIKGAINKQLIDLFEKGMSIKNFDSFLEEETLRVSENQLNPNFYNYFTFSKSHQNNLYLAFRRMLDVVCALVGIVFFIALTPLVALGNLIANRGSLLYKQTRVGKRGKEFKIIKFRSMVVDAEKNGAEWAKKNDVRVTRFGRLLRKTRLDEVPQFINVFKGEMSLIGPRPERPEFVTQLENEIPFYSIRHVIKPGLTGWAQVMHPYASSVDDQQKKLMYDLYYIKERNLLLDFKIVIKTISTVLFFRGT